MRSTPQPVHQPLTTQPGNRPGTQDGSGAGDHDQPYRWTFGALRALDSTTRARVAEIAELVEVHAGEPLLVEGERATDFFVIERGQIAVFRAARDGLQERHVATVGPGALLGELAMVDGSARSASARATTDSRAWRISLDVLRALPDGERVVANLKATFATSIAGRMRDLTDDYVAALERELDALRTQGHFGQFLVYVLAMMAIGSLVNDVIARNLIEVNIYTEQFAWQYLMIVLVPSLAVIWRMGISPGQVGLTLRGLRRSLLEGSMFSVVGLLVAAALAVGLQSTVGLPGQPAAFDLALLLAYLAHSFLQELIGRGFLQTSFQRFLNDARGLRSLVLASVLFGMFHLHFGLLAVALTTLSGLAFGALYLHTRNLAGVTLLHFTLGVCAFAFGLL
jgi:CRP-like cAMP-binding protein